MEKDENTIVTSFSSFLFLLIVFVLTRQVPLSMLSPLMNVSAGLLVLLSICKYKFSKYDLEIVGFFLVLPLTISLLYSIFLESNSISNAFRFYIILLFVGLAYFIEIGLPAIRWFVYLHVFQVFVLIGISILLMVVGFNNYLPIRAFFLEAGWGDVYSFTGLLYKIQIKGNALILFSFFLVNQFKIFKQTKFFSAILFLGVILSGNFSFIIIAVAFILYRFLNWKRYNNVNSYFGMIVLLMICLLASFPFLLSYVEDTIEMKKDESLAIRDDQLNILLNDLGSNFFRLFLGAGLGNTVEVFTTYRDYRGVNYYELQSVYLFNQLGIVFSILFIIYNLLIVFKKWILTSVIVVYILYLIYSSTNPYMLDTNHFVVIVVLNSIQKQVLKGKIHLN